MTAKTAFLFPGQGSQYSGMGSNLAELETAKNLFARADEILGFSLSGLCREGPEEELTKTENAQPAIFTVSTIVYGLLREEGIEPAYMAGHSLGEYSALTAGGAFAFDDALRLVRKRGELMARACSEIAGGMAAVIGLDPEAVAEVCREASCAGVVEAANFNSPGQIAISGEKAALEKAAELAKARGAKRVLPLPVSAPFHCRLMDPVSAGFAAELEGVEIGPARVPVVANVTARPETEPEEIRENLIRQINGSVRWTETVQWLADQGVQTFVEVGPGKVLTGLIKKTLPEARRVAVESPESVAEAADALQHP